MADTASSVTFGPKPLTRTTLQALASPTVATHATPTPTRLYSSSLIVAVTVMVRPPSSD